MNINKIAGELMQEIMIFGVIGDRNATVAAISADVAGVHYEAAGSAKREKGDTYSEDIGVTLSAARALHDLAGRMETVAKGKVEAAEREKQAVFSRRIRHAEHQVSQRKPRALLTIEEIGEKYGPDAAKLARRRRTIRFASKGT